MESWESLKARAKCLQAQLDSKMQELGRLNKRLQSAPLDGQIDVVVSQREDVERSLNELAETSEALSRVAATSAQAAQAARLRETQLELVRDFKRVVESIDSQYQHARLLPKNRGSSNGAQDDAEANLMREKAALNSTLSATDELISQGQTMHDMLKGQRSALTGIHGKVGTLESVLPGINSLIDKISDRKNKERVVLSMTVASCCFFTIWYKFF